MVVQKARSRLRGHESARSDRDGRSQATLGSRSRSCLRSQEAALPHPQAFQTVVPPRPAVREAHDLPRLRIVLPAQPAAQPLESDCAATDPAVPRAGTSSSDVSAAPGPPPTVLRSSLPLPPSRAVAEQFEQTLAPLLEKSEKSAFGSVRKTTPVPSQRACWRPAVPRRTTAGLHMPQTSIRLPANSSVRRNTFSSHGFSSQSKITKWPASAPHRSM